MSKKGVKLLERIMTTTRQSANIILDNTVKMTKKSAKTIRKNSGNS